MLTGHCMESIRINLRVYDFFAFWVSPLSSIFGSGSATLFRCWPCTVTGIAISVPIFFVITSVLSLGPSVFARLVHLWCW